MIPRARLVVPVFVVLAAVVGLMIWLFTQTTDRGSRTQMPVPPLPTRHPVFGEIHETSAMDTTEVPDVRGPAGLLPKIPVFMVLGNHLLEWSAADVRPKREEGYLYFRDPNSVWKRASNSQISNVWAFAACTKSQVVDVASNDLSVADFNKGSSSFGTDWIDSPEFHAVRVRPGHVILARHSAEPSKIYAVELTRQERGRLQARYVEISQEGEK